MKQIFIVGCGRSGTMYMSEVFKVLGLDVGHEVAGADGISSWFHSFGMRQKNILKKDYKTAHPLEGRYFIHLVRNPLKVIMSMARITTSPIRYGLGYFKDLCPEAAKDYEGLELAMAYWVFWNEMTVKRGARVDKTLRVESITEEDELRSICYGVGIDYQPEFLDKIKALGKEVHKIQPSKLYITMEEHPHLSNPLDLETMRGTNQALSSKVEKLAFTYGYFLEDE